MWYNNNVIRGVGTPPQIKKKRGNPNEETN